MAHYETTYLNVKFSAIFIPDIKKWISCLRNQVDLEITTKFDPKVNLEITIKFDPKLKFKNISICPLRLIQLFFKTLFSNMLLWKEISVHFLEWDTR